MEHFTLPSILSSFGYSEDLVIRQKSTYAISYLGVNLYYPETTLFRHSLYIVEGNAVPGPLLSDGFGCILIPASDAPYAGPYAAETVIWPDQISAGFLLNRIQNLYLSCSAHTHMAHSLMPSLSLSASIGAIVHQAAAIMQNAIILLDPAYQLIAMEGLGCEINDIFWNDCLKDRRVSDAHIALLKNSGLTKDLEQASSAALWEKNDYFNHIPRLAQKIYSPDHVYLGTIAVVQCMHTFTADDVFMLEALVENLSTALAHYDYLTDSQKADSQLLHALLSPRFAENISNTAKRRMLEISRYKFYMAGFIPLCNDPALSRLGGYIQATLLSEKDEVLSSLENKNVLLLMCVENFKDFLPIRHWLNEKLSPMGISIGLSPAFTDLTQSVFQFSLSKKAVSLGMAHAPDHSERIFPYQSVSHFQLLDALPRATLEQFISDSSIQPVCSGKYLDLCKTLQCFVRHLGNYSETAQELFIHKNTLLYRLSKIRALTGFDYTSSEDILSVAVSLSVLEYIHNNQPTHSRFPCTM